MFIGYEQIAATAVPKTASALTIPPRATHAMLQAETQNVRFRMDNQGEATTTSGMILLTTEPPELYLIEDLKRINFCRSGGSDAKLNIHYACGRDV